MRIITFTPDDRRALVYDRYHHPDPRVQRKMEVLWLKSHGLNHDDIAAYADVSLRTVQRYLDEYLEGGLERLRRGPRCPPRAALIEHEVSLEEYFEEHPVRSVKQARAVIEQRTGIRRGLSQVRHFLKGRLGLRGRRTGAIPVPPKKTIPEHAREQSAFLRDQLEPRLEQARRGRRQVYFVDAAHFVSAPFLGCLWCAARLFVRAASGRKRHNVLGAFDAVAHRLIRVTNQGYINAEVARHIDEVQIFEMNENLQKAIASENKEEIKKVAEQIEKKGELMGPRAAKKTMLAKQALNELNAGGRVSKKTQLAMEDVMREADMPAG